MRGICWCGECTVFVLRYLWSCHNRFSFLFTLSLMCKIQLSFLALRSFIYCVVLNCIILRIVSNILPSSCM